jgi:hypothetical protein
MNSDVMPPDLAAGDVLAAATPALANGLATPIRSDRLAAATPDLGLVAPGG